MNKDNLQRRMDDFKASSCVGQYIKPAAKKVGTSCVVWIKSFNKHDPEVEFLPAALEVLETPVSPAERASALLICLFFSVAVLWACIGKVDLIATAQGKIIPTGHTKIIQPLEPGIVRAIHVQDGQAVRAGDVLIEIDATISAAEKDRLQKELTAAELDIARLKAALEMGSDPAADFVPPVDAGEQDIDLQRSQLISQVQEIKSKLQSMDQQIAQNEGNRLAVQATIDKLGKSMPMLKERAHMRSVLSNKGYGSKLDMLSAQQDLVEHQQELQVQKGRLLEAASGVASLKEQRQQVEAEFRQKALDQLSQDKQKAESLHEQIVQANQKYRLQTLQSPVDGTVQQLAVHTEGGVVTPAQALLAIVPADTKLEIEAMISNRDIGFVHEGQDVEIKVDTFNFTKYGFVHGKVLSVSHDAVVQQANDNVSKDGSLASSRDDSRVQQLTYTARISLDQTKMRIDRNMENLMPGMAVTAEIKTGSQRVIQFLLSPLYRDSEEAMHER